MNAEDNIRTLEETRQEIIRFTTEIETRLSNKEIDGIEYHLLLNEKLQGKSKEEVLKFIEQRIAAEKNTISSKTNEYNYKKKKAITFGAAAIILVLITALIIFNTNPGSLTGYIAATKDIPKVISYNQLFEHYTETQLDLTNLTSLKISGVLEGTGAKVKLRINNIDYLIANIVNPASAQDQITGMVTGGGTETPAPEYTLTSNKPSYALGEAVALAVAPDVENISFYVITGEQTQKLDANTFTTQSPGEHQAVAIIVLPNDMLRLETNFTVTEEMLNGTNQTNETNQTNQTNQTNETNTTIIPEIPPEMPVGYQFTSLCLETCSLDQANNPILIVELDENSTLTISTIEIVQTKENQEPIQDKNIPDITLTTGQPLTIDLNDYFTDPDGDTLQYDLNNIPEINATIVGQHDLTITSEAPGQYIAYIYATDGNKLTTSNTFQIIITEATPENSTNQTTNETNQTTNGTASTPSPQLADCSDPNPNNRPLECLDNAEFFQDQTILITGISRNPIARITPIGNILIKGEVLELDTFTPAEEDYLISYEDNLGVRRTTIWFDSSTGNIHLKGRLSEENSNNEPAPGSFVIRNRKGIVLAWANPETGDLYIRGNVIPYRPDIMR